MIASPQVKHAQTYLFQATYIRHGTVSARYTSRVQRWSHKSRCGAAQSINLSALPTSGGSRVSQTDSGETTLHTRRTSAASSSPSSSPPPRRDLIIGLHTHTQHPSSERRPTAFWYRTATNHCVFAYVDTCGNVCTRAVRTAMKKYRGGCQGRRIRG